MQIPTEFKGTIYFYYWPYLDCFMVHDKELNNPDYIYLGSHDLSVEFDISDAAGQAVAVIENQISRIRAEMAQRIEILEGQKQSLLALEHKES